MKFLSILAKMTIPEEGVSYVRNANTPKLNKYFLLSGKSFLTAQRKY